MSAHMWRASSRCAHFSECLRQELRDLPNVDVATILPEAVDTPIFQRAANVSGRAVRPVPPLVDADEVAEGIVACARSPQREVTYGRAGRALELLHSHAPGLYACALPPAFEAGNYRDQAAAPTEGVVLGPDNAIHAIRGGWKQRRRTLAEAFVETMLGGVRGLMGRGGTRREP
jgi:hypothetical protein